MTDARQKWAERVRGYCDEQENYESREAYCAQNGLSRAAFYYWLYRLSTDDGSGRSGRRVFLDVPDNKRAAFEAPSSAPVSSVARIALGARDVEVLKELAHDRVCGVDVIAMRHFKSESEALRAMRRLQRAGYVKMLQREGGVVSLSHKGARAVDVRAPRRMHPRHLAHHVKTLRAIELLRRSVEAKGGRFVAFEGSEASPGYRLEIHVQSASRKGGTTRKGATFEAAPDGVVNIQWSDGRVEEVAVEYYTSSYSDAQMEQKRELQRHYDGVHQVADTPRTAERVLHATGRECSVL